MRVTLIDEVGLRTKDGKRIFAGLKIKKIEIPDEVLAEIKKRFELLLQEQSKKEELSDGRN